GSGHRERGGRATAAARRATGCAGGGALATEATAVTAPQAANTENRLAPTAKSERGQEVPPAVGGLRVGAGSILSFIPSSLERCACARTAGTLALRRPMPVACECDRTECSYVRLAGRSGGAVGGAPASALGDSESGADRRHRQSESAGGADAG